MKKRERKKRKSEKKRKRDRSRSRSRSPRDRIKYHQRSKERRQSSSSNNSVILIDERSSSRERERSRRISGSKPDMRLYQPPLLPRNTTITINPQKLDALTKKTVDIKGNLSDILGMLDKKWMHWDYYNMTPVINSIITSYSSFLVTDIFDEHLHTGIEHVHMNKLVSLNVDQK